MAYGKRMAAVGIGGDDDKKKKKKKVAYQEKSGEVHSTKKKFYKSKADKEKSDKVMYRTSDGKTWATKAEYDAHKKKLNSKTPYKRRSLQVRHY